MPVLVLFYSGSGRFWCNTLCHRKAVGTFFGWNFDSHINCLPKRSCETRWIRSITTLWIWIVWGKRIEINWIAYNNTNAESNALICIGWWMKVAAVSQSVFNAYYLYWIAYSYLFTFYVPPCIWAVGTICYPVCSFGLYTFELLLFLLEFII